MADELNNLHVVEFYSGIGGMHYALKECGAVAEVVAAYDINTTANQVYHFNFKETSLLQSNIEGLSSSRDPGNDVGHLTHEILGLTIHEIDALNPDMFLMSPPCQPFTRVGLQGDSSDARSKSFLHILNLLPKLLHPPSFILMENVKGFETSNTRECFVKILKSCKYQYQEFLLSPNQFGVPNSRLRYYLLAKKEPLQFYFPCTEKIMDSIPNYKKSNHESECCYQGGNDGRTTCQWYSDHGGQWTTQASSEMLPTNGKSSIVQSDSFQYLAFCSNCIQNRNGSAKPLKREECFNNKRPVKCTAIGEYLEKDMDDKYFHGFLVPDKILGRFALLLDIVDSQSDHSCCFTKAYGHYAEGTGSVLKMANMEDTEIFDKYRQLADVTEKSQLLTVLKLRYFTPREVANLHCFPSEFGFPPSVTVKQRYRLLGNSLNVHVVAELLSFLFQSP